jgi:hypothetical protein
MPRALLLRQPLKVLIWVATQVAQRLCRGSAPGPFAAAGEPRRVTGAGQPPACASGRPVPSRPAPTFARGPRLQLAVSAASPPSALPRLYFSLGSVVLYTARLPACPPSRQAALYSRSQGRQNVRSDPSAAAGMSTTLFGVLNLSQGRMPTYASGVVAAGWFACMPFCACIPHARLSSRGAGMGRVNRRELWRPWRNGLGRLARLTRARACWPDHRRRRRQAGQPLRAARDVPSSPRRGAAEQQTKGCAGG